MMNIKRIILLTLILIGIMVINPLGFRRDSHRSKDPTFLNPEHLTEEYEFKDTKVLWRLEEDMDEDE